MYAKSMTLSKADVERAFQENEFTIALQPQIEVESGAAVAAEAFVRWAHPQFGLLMPQLFLPFVESVQYGPRLLGSVTRLALDAANALAAGGRPWRVSINLGAGELASGAAASIIEASLLETGGEPASLVLEAPDAALAKGDPAILETVERLRDMGCALALDSGGGLPLEAAEIAPDLFSEVKTGGPAIMRFAEIARKVDGGRIARRLNWAKAHGLNAVAVGVESERTLVALVKLGFTAVQGALVAKPAPLDALLAWDGAWAGEARTGEAAPAPTITLRPRPRLVVPPPEPEAAPKLVEQLRPAPDQAFYGDEDEDALDVDFDDDAFGAPPGREEEAEADPSEDVEADGEELHALETAAPLHAGMIERPKKRLVMQAPEVDLPPPPAPVAGPAAPAFDRPLALRVKAPPVQKTLLQRLGLSRAPRR